MAKEEKKGGGKKGIGGCLAGVLAIVLIIVMLGSFIFAIFEMIMEFIKNILLGIINLLLDFLAHPIKFTIKALGAFSNELQGSFNGTFDGWALEKTQPNQLIEVSQDSFKEMRDSIDESISRDAVGLDDMMMKKILLAYNTGKYSRNADIIIELTDEEGEAATLCSGCKNCVGCGFCWECINLNYQDCKKTCTSCDSNTDASPFCVVQGKDIDQLSMNVFENIANDINRFVDALFTNGNIFDSETYKEGKDERRDKQDTYYLYARGVLKFVGNVQQMDGTTKEEELVYYDQEILDQLYEKEYEKKKDWENRDYAESVWNYLSSKCYTDGDKGMKMYAHEIIDEQAINWSFKDNSWFTSVTKINKQLISNFSKVRMIQDVDYYSLVSQYATPVEFMIDLLNISSSKEFVNAFIDKVTNETSVTLKIYRIRQSTCEEKTEDINETTIVDAEAKVTATVTKVDYDGDALGYLEEDAGIDTRVTLSGGTAVFGAVETTKIKVRLYNIPEEVQAAEVQIKYAKEGTTRYRYSPGGLSDITNIFTDKLGSSDTIELEAWFPRYKTLTNTGKINRVTRTGYTETKLDIAVEEADTWYGKIKFNNYVEDNIHYESINNSDSRVIVWTASPIILNKTKSDEVYVRDSSNKDTIFSTSKSVEGMIVDQVICNIENWYANLTSDNIFYWGLGGPITHNIYEWLDGDRGFYLSDENELLNIRFIYAMESELLDGFNKNTYTPVKVTYRADDYKVGYLYTTVNNELIKETQTVTENSDFFLSLLKNNTGEYSRDASYNPNGQEVVYSTVYDSEDRVGRFFETSAEMLFSLLERSPNTQSLADIMRYILYQYTTRDYGVTEFNYEIFERAGFELI